MAAQTNGVEPNIVRRFLDWTRHADAERRADAANALARAFLHSDLEPLTRREAELGLYALLDDPSSLVRRSLAEGLAGGASAPPAIIMALAADTSDVAAVVLRRSPVLAEADLVDAAATGDVEAQIAIAERPALGVGAGAALAEVGDRNAVMALLDNPTAALAPLSLARICERFSDHGDIRERLVQRDDLPPATRHELLVQAAERLQHFVADCGWLSSARAQRIVQESRDGATVGMAIGATAAVRSGFVSHLRARGALTTALLLRSALAGDRMFVAAALAELSGAPANRAAVLARDARGSAFAALCARAGLSPVSAFGLSICLEASGKVPSGASWRAAAERALAAATASRMAGAAELSALLRRFCAEAARDEARAFVERARTEADAAKLPPTEDATWTAPIIEAIVTSLPAIEFDEISEDARSASGHRANEFDEEYEVAEIASDVYEPSLTAANAFETQDESLEEAA